MYNLIYDVDEVNKFFSILSPLKDDEVYFISLSARNKYLDEKEREFYNLGRSEMFARKLIRQGKQIKALRGLESNDGSYLTKNGKDIPEICMVAYANINPSSGLKAYQLFQETTTKDLFQIMDNSNILHNFARLDVKLMNCFQQATGTKTLIDIDFDIPLEGKNILDDFLTEMKKEKIGSYVIETHGGFHVLLIRADIHCNYTEYVKKANTEAQSVYGMEHVEVVVNKNAMVPIPGTLQGGFKVKIIEESLNNWKDSAKKQMLNMNLTEEFKYIDNYFDSISKDELIDGLIKCGMSKADIKNLNKKIN